MSEAEIIETFQNYQGLISDLIFGYIGLMSGFLVMSYLIADRLSGVLVTIVITLFSLVSAIITFRIYLHRFDLVQLIQHMYEVKQMDPQFLPWWGSNPTWAGTVITYLEIGALFGGFVGCIVFFFYQRSTKERNG